MPLRFCFLPSPSCAWRSATVSSDEAIGSSVNVMLFSLSVTSDALKFLPDALVMPAAITAAVPVGSVLIAVIES